MSTVLNHYPELLKRFVLVSRNLCFPSFVLDISAME